MTGAAVESAARHARSCFRTWLGWISWHRHSFSSWVSLPPPPAVLLALWQGTGGDAAEQRLLSLWTAALQEGKMSDVLCSTFFLHCL